MNANTVTPTEALLQAAKTHPFAPAVRAGSVIWSYAALWDRVRNLSNQLDLLDQSGAPIGLFMGLEIDYVAAAHAVWLSGRTVVVLSPKWTSTILDAIIQRSNVRIVLYGNTVPSAELHVPFFCTYDFVSSSPPQSCPAPHRAEFVDKVPIICSVTPTSGSTGVPKSIVYPMRRSLAVLDEESSTLLQPMDGQWLRGGTTFLRPLFEIRRFMFNQTTLYLDAAISVADQCASFCGELEDSSNSQPLRVHFTPSVFHALVDYIKMKYGSQHTFSRLYWMVIGGESLSVTDIHLAKRLFPKATIACNYACSEVGFAGVCQMFVRPDEPVPEIINFDATQGCEDLVLLDDDMNIIPKCEGASGIIGIITTASATNYMGNAEATNHMFRPWGGDRILLYTDDIGNMGPNGRISINGRRSRNVKVNGLFVDMDCIERALVGCFRDGTVNAFKLVKSDEKIVLFWTGSSTDMEVLKCAHETLSVKLGDNLAMVIASTRCIKEMPYNASYKIDLAQLQSIADDDTYDAIPDASSAVLQVVVNNTDVTCSHAYAVAEEIAAKVAKLSNASDPVSIDVPLTLAGLNSITVVQMYFWLQEHFEYEDDMSRLFEEDVSAMVLARDITGESETSEELTEEGPSSSSNRKIGLAMDIAHEVARLANSSQPVSIDLPLMFVGLNSVTAPRLHSWLRSTFNYNGDVNWLFQEDCSAEALADSILQAGPDTLSNTDVSDEEPPAIEAEVTKIAGAIAIEVARLSNSTGPVPTDVPLTLVGLNSITVVQLYFWLQSHYDYEDISRLFEKDVSAETVARDIAFSDPLGSTFSTAVNSDSKDEIVESADEVPNIAVSSVSPDLKAVETDSYIETVVLAPASETSTESSDRRMRRPKALDLSLSSSVGSEPKMPEISLKSGRYPSGMLTADIRKSAMLYGLLALTLLSPSWNGTHEHGGTPALIVMRPSLDMLADIQTPIVPVSPWVTDVLSPNIVLCA